MTITINGTTGIAGVDGSASVPAVQGNDTNTGMFFPTADTIAFATAGTEDMRIDPSGNVGIGTSSPAERLHVQDGDIRIQQALPELKFVSEGAVNRWYIGANINDSVDGGLCFGNGTSIGNNERMRIDNIGRLLVGTTAFAGGRINTVTATALWGLAIFDASGNTAMIQFVNAAGSQAGSVVTSGNVTIYNTSSDYRLKENIQPMTGALDKIAQLKPCTYKWKSDGSDGDGFIAHELAEVCPQAVVGEKDAVNEDGSIKPQGIDTSFLVATLTAAIQEQQAIIEQLKADVAALKGTA